MRFNHNRLMNIPSETPIIVQKQILSFFNSTPIYFYNGEKPTNTRYIPIKPLIPYLGTSIKITTGTNKTTILRSNLSE